MTTFQPGTVIHGTLREVDLMRAFANLLLDANPSMHRDTVNETHAAANAYENHPETYLDTYVEPYEIINELIDALQNYAPDGHYFGAHVGDGSDFGFWPVED